MSNKEDTLQPVLDIFRNFDELAKKLDDIPEQAKTKTDILLDVFFNKEKDIFEDPQIFLSALNDLSEEVGHAYHTVLAIELKRMGLTPPPTPMPIMPKTDKSASQLIVQTQPPKGGGFWDFWGTRSYAKVWERYLKQNAGLPSTPQVTTSKEVVDILEFGRQLIPEFNRVQEYFQHCIEHLSFFNDKDTKERFHSELRKHMNKLSGIIRVFSRTSAEYRKELIGERKRDIAKMIIGLNMMAMSSEQGIPGDKMARAINEMSSSERR